MSTAIAEAQAVVKTGSLPVIIANRQQMVQLFQNLISNAIKYRAEKPPEIQISADLGNRGEWIFSVRDNGIGFEMRYAQQVGDVQEILVPCPGSAPCREACGRLGRWSVFRQFETARI